MIINHDHDFCLEAHPVPFQWHKTFETFSGIRKTSSNQNSHSLQRNNSHKHGNGNRNPEAGGARSGKHVSNKEVGSGKVSKPGKTRGPHHSSHNNHVSEVTSLHVSGAPDVTGPRGHHSHDAHYFVDYWGVSPQPLTEKFNCFYQFLLLESRKENFDVHTSLRHTLPNLVV